MKHQLKIAHSQGRSSVVALIAGLVVIMGGVGIVMVSPIHEGRVVRDQVMTGIAIASGFKVSVVDYFEQHQRYPSANEDAGLPEQISDDNVRSIELREGGRVEITYSKPEMLKDKKLFLTPSIGSSTDSLIWMCESPDIEPIYLPNECRKK